MATDVLITGDGLSALETIADNPAPLGPGGGVEVEGTSAAGATDDGSNPVKVGGVYTATAPTLTDGQRGNIPLDLRGNLRVVVADPSAPSVAYIPNRTATALASAARTASTGSGDLGNFTCRFIHVIINVTEVTSTPSIVVTINGKDPASGTYYPLLTSAAITGTGTTVLRVGPGLTAATNLVANDVVPRTFSIDVAHADSDSITYSIGYFLVG